MCPNKGRARKLVPKYIGPYKVVKAHNEASTVTLELSPALIPQQISLTFHMGLVWKFITNNDKVFPKWDAKSFYDFSQDDQQEWLVEEITSHRWLNLKELELEVRWMLGVRYWSLIDLRQSPSHSAILHYTLRSQSPFLFPSHLRHSSIRPCSPCLTLCPYVPCFTDICFYATMILSSLV